MCENFWFNGDEAMSYNCLYTFFQSMRGPGKTYWAKCRVVKSFLKKSHKFVYLRRYKKEMKKQKDFWKQISGVFPDVKFSQKGNELFINDELAGNLIILSTQISEKSVNFNDTYTIIFDEFALPPKGCYRYLPDEVNTFFEFYETVNRLRMNPNDEVRVIFLSNNEGFNPYFDYFKISLKRGQKVRRKDILYAENWYNPDFVKAKKNTKFGRLIDGTRYGDYAIEGEAWDQDDAMISARPKDSILWYNLSVLGNTYGLWGSKSAKKLVVSKAYDPCARIFCLSRPEMRGGMELILPRDPRIKSLSENYKFGMVYYETPQIKDIVAPAIARL